MTTLRLALLLARRGEGSRAAVILPIVAFAVSTALLLTVVAGAVTFFTFPDADATLYPVLAIVATLLLVVPLTSLGASAARLSARRRDDRLSSLRLLGGTPGLVVRLTALESTALAFVGALVGVGVHLATLPLVGLIPFRGAPLGLDALLLPAPVIAALVAAVCALAAGSALLGMTRVTVSPLGVRTRRDAPKVHWIRLALGAVAIVAAFVVSSVFDVGVGNVIVGVMLTVMIGGSMAVLDLIGPFAVRTMGRIRVRRAATADRLIAARGVLEDPKAAWRQVSGVAMTSFMAVFAGSGVAMLTLMYAADPDEAFGLLIDDIGTGLTITVAISFLMVACSVGVNQAADVYDRGSLYRDLAAVGMPRQMLHRSRERTVMAPLLLVALGSAGIAAVVALPAVGAAFVFAPATMGTIAASIAAGILVVWAGLRLTRPVLTARLAARA